MRRQVESQKLEDKPEKERGCRNKVAGEKGPTSIMMNDVEDPPNISLDEFRGRGREAISSRATRSQTPHHSIAPILYRC